MKTALLCALMYVFTPYTKLNLTEVRTAYEHASKDEAAAKKLFSRVDENPSGSTIIMGYKGAVTMILAKYQYNPLRKLEYFNAGKSILEQAIAKDRNNVELIFIRFTIQSYSPSFLKYNKDLVNDKYFLLTRVNDLTDKDLQQRITKFLKGSPHVSTLERNTLPS